MANVGTLSAMTGMKSGKKKTHRGHRGGKSHSKPPMAKAPGSAAHAGPPPGALAALLAGAPPDATAMAPDPNAMAMGGSPVPSSDPTPHLIAALAALHGQKSGTI